MFVCSCFGITEQQVREHAAAGACTPRDIASQSKAGTDCGSCVRRIQGLLGRGECPRRDAMRRRLERTAATSPPGPAAPSAPALPSAPAVAAAPSASAASSASAGSSAPSVTEGLPARLESALA